MGSNLLGDVIMRVILVSYVLLHQSIGLLRYDANDSKINIFSREFPFSVPSIQAVVNVCRSANIITIALNALVSRRA